MQKKLPVFFLLWICAWGCNRTTDDLLSEAARMMSHNRDSASLILQKINHSGKLEGKQQADYCRMMSEISLKYPDLKQADSLITIALEYDRNMADSASWYQSLFLKGYIDYRSGRTAQALVSFTKADSLLKPHEYPEHGATHTWMGQCYAAMKDYPQAIAYWLRVIEFKLKNNNTSVWNNHWNIAYAYRMAKEYDNSMDYYRKAQAGLNGTGNRYVSNIFNEMCETCIEMNDYRLALLYADSCMMFKTSRKDIPLFNLAKARVFMKLNRHDSVMHYIKTAIQAPDQYVAIAACQYLSEYEREVLHYKDAYYALQNYEHHFNNLESQIETGIVYKKYEEERLKNENNLLKLAKREREIYLLICGLVLSMIFIAYWFFYTRNRKKRLMERYEREEQELKTRAILMENANRLLKTEHELSVLREKAAGLRESLFRKMSVSHKIPSLENIPDDETLINKRITLTEQDWDELIQTVDEAYNGFVERLYQICPVLGKTDIGFCCLVKIKVSLKDLSDIYCVSKAGITKRKTRMKKDKFGITDESVTLDDFLQTV